jgi:serine phosphatase RsbU (regulator of sigma subunit)
VQFANVHESTLRLDRRDRELLTAKEVQRHFLPSGRPEIPGYEFYDYYVPADEIGGDYFGYIALPENRLAIAMGDVAGKGVSAALLMARLCSEVPYRLVMSPSPAEAMQRLNQELFGPDFECPFVTFVLCVLDPVAHTLTFANAGHLPPLWRHASSRVVEELGIEQSGLPLGVEQQPDYRAHTIHLDPGDIVVMYTDGISEAVNGQGTLYGSGRVRDVVATGPLEPAALGRVIIQKLKQFQEDAPQTDDTCLLCFARAK